MKRINRLLIAGLMLFSTTFGLKAQLDFDSFLEAGIVDANKLLQNYMQPAFEGFGYGLASGWYNTAKTHKTLGFDLSLTISAARVPSSAEFFTFRNSDYSNVRYDGGASVDIPTMFGPNLGADDLPQLTFLDPDTGDEIVRISAPTGLGVEEGFMPFNAVPVPMAQIGIGLPKGFELKLRYVPEQTIEEDGSVKLFGIGLMHDIKQWLPGEKILPFDLSAFVGYTSMTAQAFIDVDQDQVAEFDASSLVVQAVISKKILFMTAFAGLGYSNYDIGLNLLGTYTTETSSFTDPISLSYKNNGIRTNVGVRMKLLFLTLTGEYAFQEYNTMSLGVGFSFR
ncbi:MULTISPECIES: DUF6588 family protein [Roseivirga]|nr:MULTISPECIES: DUF6588 family protein [Roseivirga]MEC7752578.1 DUF6588 family protein [Bacteroidota bacterium]